MGVAGGPSENVGGGGARGRDPACPVKLSDAFTLDDFDSPPPSCATPGLTCDYEMQCTSGLQVLTITCEGGIWEGPGPRGCDKPYDFCGKTSGGTGTTASTCLDGEWYVSTCPRSAACDGAGPCPSEAPLDGAECMRAGTGGDREFCGFPCANDPSKWTVFNCTFTDSILDAAWVSDGACD